MSDQRGGARKETERLLAYEVGWRMGLDRAKAELRRLTLRSPPLRDTLDPVIELLDQLAASGPLPGRTGASPPREVFGEPLQLGFAGLAEDEDAAGPAYYLGGRRVQPGEKLELLLAGARWVTGIFGWTGRTEDVPTFSLNLGTEKDPEDVSAEVIAGVRTAAIPRVSFPLPEEAVLRRPPRAKEP